LGSTLGHRVIMLLIVVEFIFTKSLDQKNKKKQAEQPISAQTSVIDVFINKVSDKLISRAVSRGMVPKVKSSVSIETCRFRNTQPKVD